MVENSVSITKQLIERASSLDIGWKLLNNGSVTVHVDKNDSSTLFKTIMNHDENLLRIVKEQDCIYIAQGELRSQIIKNILENEEKIAKNSGYKSLIEKVAKEFPWKKEENKYFICTDIKTPSEQTNILNLLTFMEGNLINHPSEDNEAYNHINYNSASSYQNHYVANESLGMLIEQQIKENNKTIVSSDKIRKIIANGREGRASPTQNTNKDRAAVKSADIIQLNNRKTTHPIIFREK